MTRDLRQRLDRIAQFLEDAGVNPDVRIEQISYLIYLKVLDEEEDDRESGAGPSADDGVRLFRFQAKRYRWSEWRVLRGDQLRNFLGEEVFWYMASLFKDDPQVAAFFRGAELEINDPGTLERVIDELDGIEFRKLGSDVKGGIFEYLLARLGQFRTPRQIRAFMVQMTDPDLGDTICDPACGTAGFLIDAVDHILARYSESPEEIPIYGEDWLEKRDGQTLEEAKREIPNLQTYRKGNGELIPDWGVLEASIHGTEISRQIMRIAVMNLVLHGIRHARVQRADVLSAMSALTQDDFRRRYDVVLSNPPMGGWIPAARTRADLPIKSRKGDVLFLSLMMHSLAPGGRCAVVVPENLLFGTTKAHTELREKLLHKYEVLAVVSLPAGVLRPYTGVKTSVLVFRRPKAETPEGEAATRHVWFYGLRNDGFDPDNIQQGGRVETPNENDIPGLLADWTKYADSRFKKPPGVEGGIVLPPGSEEPRCWWTSCEAVVANEFNLAASRYAPYVPEPLPDEDPVELIQEVLATERDIAGRLEELLELVEAS